MTETNSAPISVLMSVHNGMPYLPAAVDSILEQTFTDWKMVIVNDGSTDESTNYLNDLSDPRIKIIHQEQQGLAAALNHGIQHCDTPFLARLDSDDIALPTRLEKQYQFMRKHPEVGLLGTQFNRLGPQRSGFPSKLPCGHDEITEALMEGKHAMCHPTIMCQTQIMRDVGGYWEHPIAQDWDIYLKMSEKSKLANLDEVLLYYRIHNASLNGQKLAKIRHHQRYAAECARRRHEDLPWIELSEYAATEKQRPWTWQVRERLNEHAMRRYRAALNNILGDHPNLGYAQLGMAALCSPTLTAQRIRRMLSFRQSKNQPESVRPQTTDSGSRTPA
tara:strand:- start:7473 stop:8471 length:999 start_codon:yes stop_codon:yes gene_type:complete